VSIFERKPLRPLKPLSGDAAAVTLEFEAFDYLITDVRMPGTLDGIEVAAHARRRNPRAVQRSGILVIESRWLRPARAAR